MGFNLAFKGLNSSVIAMFNKTIFFLVMFLYFARENQLIG